jgi:hypothetical protein
MRTVRKQFYLPLDLNDLLIEEANQQNIAEAEVLRRALADYFLNKYQIPIEEPFAMLAGIGISKKKRREWEND